MEDIEETVISTSTILDSLAEIEKATDDVLMDKAQLIEMDKKHQENRLAERKLRSLLNSERSVNGKMWMAFGNTFIKLPAKTAHCFLESNQDAISNEINNLRDGLKEKVNRLNELEGKGPLNG